MTEPSEPAGPDRTPFEPVLEAIERAAEGILREAESEAERRLVEAEARAERIARERAAEASRVSDQLLALADQVRVRADELLHAIDGALAELGERSGPGGSRSLEDEPAAPAPEGEPVAPATDAPAPEGAILLATQMALSGASREQIESRLRDDFGIEDPGAILARIGS